MGGECANHRAVSSQVLTGLDAPLPLGGGLGAYEGVCQDHTRNCSNASGDWFFNSMRQQGRRLSDDLDAL